MAAFLAFLMIFLLAVMPHLSVVLTSLAKTGSWYQSLLPRGWTLGHYRQALVDEIAFPSVVRSIEYASLATLVAVTVGLMAAMLIVRGDLPGQGFFDALSMLPLAVPGLVLSFGYLAISVWFKPRLGNRTPAFLDVQGWPLLCWSSPTPRGGCRMWCGQRLRDCSRRHVILNWRGQILGHLALSSFEESPSPSSSGNLWRGRCWRFRLRCWK